MKYQKQRYLHRPENRVYGDCARTVYAALGLAIERKEKATK